MGDSDQIEQSESQTLRDDRGRFVKGTRGGPGNTTPKKVARLRSKLIEFVEEHDALNHIVSQLIQIVIDPNEHPLSRIKAAEVVLSYTLGKPTEGLDVIAEVEALHARLSLDSPTMSFSQTVRRGFLAGDE